MSTEVLMAVIYVATLILVIGLVGFAVALCRAAKQGDEMWEDALSQKRFAPVLDGMGDEFDEVTWLYPDLGTVTCPRCDGDGEISFLGNWPDPQSEDSARCPTCHGDGVVSA